MPPLSARFILVIIHLREVRSPLTRRLIEAYQCTWRYTDMQRKFLLERRMDGHLAQSTRKWKNYTLSMMGGCTGTRRAPCHCPRKFLSLIAILMYLPYGGGWGGEGTFASASMQFP